MKKLLILASCFAMMFAEPAVAQEKKDNFGQDVKDAAKSVGAAPKR
jgi:hypothetical protein